MKASQLFCIALALAPSCLVWAAPLRVDRLVSEVAVDVKASPPHHFACVPEDYDCSIDIDAQSLLVSKASFSFSFADLKSGNKGRDKKMLGWIDNERFPKASFELTSAEVVDGKMLGKGLFTMHGQSREIELPFSVSREGERFIIEGTADFDYRDWDLEIITLLFFKVKPELHVRIHLEGVLEKGGEA